MKEKILNKFKDLDFIIFLLGGVVLASLLFVLFYQGAINEYSQYISYCDMVKGYSPLLAFNASSLLGYSLIAKMFGSSLLAYKWVGYGLFVLGYFIIGIIAYWFIYKLSKKLTRYLQILIIPISLMILLNPNHLLSSFESFIIPLSFALLGLNCFVFYLLIKKNGLKTQYLYIAFVVTFVIQILFGSLLSLLAVVAFGVYSFAKYRKSKDNNDLISLLSSVTIVIAYIVLLVASHHESGLVFHEFKVLTLAKGFLTNISSALIGPYSETRYFPSFVFVLFGGLLFAFEIFVICFDLSKSKKLTLRTFVMIFFIIAIMVETILNGGTVFFLFFNPFGLCSSILSLATLYTVIYDLKYLVSKESKFNTLHPDLKFFLCAAILCLLLVGSLLAFGTVRNL